MTWEQKFAAMKALERGLQITLNMRAPGDWYVGGLPSRKKPRSYTLESYVVGTIGGTPGKTPEEAVNLTWEMCIDPKYYLVLIGGGKERIAIRWNGFMWEPVDEKTA